jgi:hypothetical protein
MFGIADWIKQMNRDARDYQEMPVELRQKLDKFYAPIVRRIEQILKRRVQAWRDRATVDISEPDI